jgi:hypothetical protein
VISENKLEITTIIRSPGKYKPKCKKAKEFITLKRRTMTESEEF